MPRVDMQLRGVEDVDRLLSQVAPRQAKNIMRATVHGIAGEIRDDARDRAPSDGPPVVLKKNIRAKRERGLPGYVESTVRVAPKAFYWKFLELGTVKMAARPFFGPAVQAYRATQAIFLRQFVTKFEAALARARKRQGL